MYQPGQGWPPPTPPVPSTNRRVFPWVIGGLVLLLVVALIPVVLLVGGSDDGGGTSGGSGASPMPTGLSHLAEAAGNLGQAGAAQYKGSYTNTSGREIPIEVAVTAFGSMTGTLELSGTKVELLIVDGEAFLKAGADFWSAQNGISADVVAEYAKQWVKASTRLVDVDLSALLAPAVIASDLLSDAANGGATVTSGEPVKGVPTEVATTDSGVVHMTTEEPRRIVRIERRLEPAVVPSTSASSGGDVGGYTWGEVAFEIEVAEMGDQEVTQLYTTLGEKATQLRESVDSTVNFSVDGQGTLDPCTETTCVATIVLRGTVDAKSSYAVNNRPITVKVTIDMTLDNTPVASCPQQVSIPPNGTATVKCTAKYSLRPGQRSYIRATWRAYAVAAADTDVQRYTDDLKEESAKKTKPATIGDDCKTAVVAVGVPAAVADQVAAAVTRAGRGEIRYYGQDGKEFTNTDGGLSQQPAGYYTEWAAAANNADLKKNHRVIIGGPPARPDIVYYWDHATTYVRCWPR